jgi:thioredoxin reductase (NADPH)
MHEFDFKKDVPQAFPVLDDKQLAVVAEFAKCRTYNDGDVLFRAGETDFKFDVIRSGAIEIYDRSSGHSQLILTHEAGEFTGDLANLTGRTSNVDAIAKGETEVYEICEPDLRRIISERPDLSDLILRTFIVRAQSLSASSAFTGLRVIGERFSHETFRLRDFLSKNHVLYTFFDIKNDSAKIDALLKAFNLQEADLPVVGYGCDWLLKNPTNDQLARRIGIKHEPVGDRLFDLAIVGGGPAGLAAAVYGASEGLKTIVIEQIATGGQAGTSSKIENYLGFPTGLSGAELAERATIQADKFGADFLLPSQVTGVEFADNLCILQVADGAPVRARSMIVATGANYRKLDVPGREKFAGAGVYYAATSMEAQICGGDSVVVVGGGNSAGQACVFLSETAHKVYLLIRGDDLGKNMSDYLAQRIYQTKNIELLTTTEITEMFGDTHLEAVELKNNQTGETKKISAAGVFSFIGAIPRTKWLDGEVELDEKGFIKTGTFIDSEKWTHSRPPFYLETSRPGVFAAGDVRCHSVKRVASSVGEGSMAVTFAHQYLAEQKAGQNNTSHLLII